MNIYSNISPIQLSVQSLSCIFKASKVSGLLQLRDSKDSSVSLSCTRSEIGSLGTPGSQLTLLNVVSISKRLSVTHKQTKLAWEELKGLRCLVVALSSIENDTLPSS